MTLKLLVQTFTDDLWPHLKFSRDIKYEMQIQAVKWLSVNFHQV